MSPVLDVPSDKIMVCEPAQDRKERKCELIVGCLQTCRYFAMLLNPDPNHAFYREKNPPR